MTHVTCRLTAKNRDQLWNPTLGNRVWATFTFFTVVASHCYDDSDGDDVLMSEVTRPAWSTAASALPASEAEDQSTAAELEDSKGRRRQSLLLPQRHEVGLSAATVSMV